MLTFTMVSISEPELHCPTCGYNLTGLPESRCPECGNTFDREQLLLSLAMNRTEPFHWRHLVEPLLVPVAAGAILPILVHLPLPSLSFLLVVFLVIVHCVWLAQRLASAPDSEGRNTFGTRVLIVVCALGLVLIEFGVFGFALVYFSRLL